MAIAADLCIVNGRVFDGKLRTESTAVAVSNGRIIAVGDNDTVLALRQSDTRVVDAAGGAILPGFVDAHAHVVFAGVERLSLDLTPAESAEQTMELIAEAAARLDETGDTDAWLTGGGWAHELFEHPTRHQLDAVVSNRPVALSDAGHHTLWVNSRALEIAGIDRNTPQPANGHIYMDEQGEPTGYLNEGGTDAITPFVLEATLEEMVAGLLDAQQFLWTQGITGWHEAILGEYNGKADATPAYAAAVEQGTLKSLASGALWIPPGTTIDEIPALVERMETLRARNTAAGLPSTTCKVMIDGVPHGETAALLSPYCSHPHSGALHLDEATIHELILRLDERGFAMHLHVMGDRGIRVALDAIEAARQANGPGPRHHVAHLSMVDAADAKRFGPLGVTANIQALWSTSDPMLARVVGEERSGRSYPFREIVASGAEIALGSDWPVSLPDPWQAIHVAVNRAHPFGPAAGLPPLAPEQALTLTEALAGYTSGSASLVLDASGRVQIGERADLTVSSRDPFELPESELYTVETSVTVVNGEVVFERG